MDRRAWLSQRRDQLSDRVVVRRSIREVLRSTGKPMSPLQVTQTLCAMDTKLVESELRGLAHNPHSDICHNGMRGRGSQYFVGVLLTERKVR
jgi:hypothetical protein